MTLHFFYKLSLPSEFVLLSLPCFSATVNTMLILSAWSYFCWIPFCALQHSLAPSGQQWPSTPRTWSLMVCYQGIQALFISRGTKKYWERLCHALTVFFTRKWCNPNVTPAKSIQCLRESESHPCPWMNQPASRLGEMAQQEGNEDFACFWMSDLIFKSKGQRRLKKNNAKIKEGILTGPVTLPLGFLLHPNKGTRANPYRNHLLCNAVKSVYIFGWFLGGFTE